MNEAESKAPVVETAKMKRKKAPYWLLWAALLPALAALGAWLITTHFPGYSFGRAFGFSCLVGALSGGLFALFNILEGCVVALCPLVLCLLAIPLLARYHWDTAGYIALNGLIAGFISSRALHKLF
jgi:hypothetical protein